VKSDTTLKLLLDQPECLVRQLLGEAVAVKQCLPTELQGNAAHVDLLIELGDGRIVHVELQAYADPEFAYRMLTYRIRIRRKYGRTPGSLLCGSARDRLRLNPESTSRIISTTTRHRLQARRHGVLSEEFLVE